MDNLYFMVGAIVGFIVAMLYELIACLIIYHKDRLRYLDKKDYKAFNKWKETHKDVVPR